MLKQQKRISTYVIVKVSGSSTERFLNLCRHRGIKFWDITANEDGFVGSITRTDFLKLKDIRSKTGMKIRILQRKGIRFLLFKYRKHYSFAIGIILACIILKLCSVYIWDIAFEGNVAYTDSVLLKQLKDISVTPGLMIKDINCDYIESILRSKYNNITWVSAEIRGTRLIIHIKENDSTVTEVENSTDGRDIVATENGVVTSIITRNGTPLVKVGDTVEKGQMLVSGVVPVHNDSGDTIGKYYVSSDADIYINTTLLYTDKLEKEYEYKNYTGRKTKYFIIGFAQNNFEIGFMPVKYNEEDIVTDTNVWKLTDSFYLPIVTGYKDVLEYETQLKEYTKEEAEQLLIKKFNKYIIDLSENKVQILSNSVTINEESASYLMNGNIEVNMPAYEYAQLTDTLQLTEINNK